jgi:hypothetical protein
MKMCRGVWQFFVDQNKDDALNFLSPGIWVKYFLSFPQKNLSPEKTETNYVFTLQFLNVKIYSYTKKKLFGTWQFGKIGVLQFWSIFHSKIQK